MQYVEWIFSGIGVFIISLIPKIVSWFQTTKPRRELIVIGVVLAVFAASGSVFLILNRSRIQPFESTSVPRNGGIGSSVILAKDDFEDGAVHWKTDSNDWFIKEVNTGDHAYCVRASGDYTFAQRGTSDWKNYLFQVNMIILSASQNGSSNIQIRANSISEAYTFNIFGEDGSELVRESEYAVLSGTSEKLFTNKWYIVKMEAVDSTIKVFIDGHLLFEVKDDNPILSGGISFGAGLESYPSEEYWEVCFDKVLVETIPS